MSFFPFFREIEGVDGLIVGGGSVALRKAEKLQPYGPHLTVIACDISPGFRKTRATIIERSFCDDDIRPGYGFVIAASDDEGVNERIAKLCREMDIPVNVVDRPELCTFLFPALVKRGDLSVGISTSGASPTAAVWLKKEIEELLPRNTESSLKWLKEQRDIVKKTVGDETERSRCMKRMFSRCLEEDGRERRGHVSLVGAGCGKKDWITVEGLLLLRSCDAVVYDDLIDDALLEEVPPGAEKIYAGKRSGRLSTGQEDIQKLLVRLAGQGKHVVRLKGGDPFVFGRGGEEIQYLNRHDIPWRVVPGISSALAIPAEAGIPVTHRGISRGIHIMTAHTGDDVLRRDMEQFAALEGTLVFLMGLESLGEIASLLKKYGRKGSTPAAVLSGGNAEQPYKVTGTLDDIAEKAKREGAVTPAVIVVGETVALDLRESSAGPLEGIRVGLTGTDDFQEKLRSKLLPLGARVVSLMKGRCRELDAEIPWKELAEPEKKWMVFTSVQGVRHFFRRCRKDRIDSRLFAYCSFAVIGPATAQELEAHGFIADICPEEYTSSSLADELISHMEDGEKAYLFCSVQASRLLEDRLSRKDIVCRRLEIYDTGFTCTDDMAGHKAAGGQVAEPDYIMLGSAGGVRALKDFGYVPGGGTEGVCIGPVCAEAYESCFGREPIVAADASAGAMIEALLTSAGEGSRKKED